MKDALRQQMREKRKALSPLLYTEKSETICRKLEQLNEFKQAQKLLIYVSLGEEVHTHLLVKNCLKQNRDLYVPRIEDGHIKIHKLHHWNELEKGHYGILEPKVDAPEASIQDMDLVIVPGLAFDKRGHRLGYGQGHYDRLLSQSNAYKVGLAFDEQIVERIPNEVHDIPLDLIITDQNLIHP